MPATFTQANRTFAVTTPLGADAFAVAGFTSREGVSRPFEVVLDLYAPADTAVAFDQLLGQGVTLDVVLPDGSKRHLNGIARALAQRGTEHVGETPRTHYRMVVVPKLWLLTRQARSRIFQQKTVPQILETVLTGLDTSFELQGTYEPREYCVQYRETDFDFLSRLMEEEGIYYFFTHADGAHTMVIGDAPLSHPDLPTGATITFDPGVGGLVPDDRISEWEKVQELTAGKVTLWDHSFELPGRNLEASADVQQTVQAGTVSHSLRGSANQALELYEYPGGYAKRFDGVSSSGGDAASNLQKISQDNQRTATIRAVQVVASALQGRGASNCRQLVAGHKFTLSGHPDADGEYVLTEVEHEARAGDLARSSAGGDGGFVYRNRFSCIPSALPFRPARRTPRPRVEGCQTAEVVGPQGEEIFTDKYGRVKVQFHWDRDGQRNASSSCWVRVATMWAGNQWGAVHIPRIGQEVVIDFLEGDPDRPIVVGSVYNANMMPPYTLPDNKTQSGIKSRSANQGSPENFNEIRFEDKKGSELLYIHAELNLETQVETDEKRLVGHDRKTAVGNDDTRIVGGKDKDGNDVGGNDTIEVKKGNRTVTIDEGNLQTQVKKGTLTTLVDTGDETHTVKQGKQTVTVETGDRIIHVKTGKLVTNVDTGAYETTVKTANAKLDVQAGKYEITAAQEVKITVGGSTITMKPSEIELKMGGTSIKLGPAGIEMKGPTVKITGDGQVEVKGAMVKVEGQGMLQMKAPMSQLNGDGKLMAKGGLTMIN
jgi:type VI secretion system secreted protein VgrG